MKESVKNLLSCLVVFLIFFILFYKAQFSFNHLLGLDAYYHIKQAWLIRTCGVEKAVKNFSWLQCNILKDYPGDIWFGYHLFLLPFTFGDLIFGAKLSSVFFNSLLFLAFFWVLKKFKVKYAFFWTASLLLVSNGLNFRLLMARPYILSILFSILGFYFIFQKKYLGIFILSLLYSFTTAEAPLIIFIAFSLTALEAVKLKKLNLKPLIFTLLGFFLGLIIRPDFPNNLFLLYHQIFDVLFLRLKDVNLNFGNELKYPFSGRVKDNLYLFLAIELPLLWIVIKFLLKKKKNIPLLHLFLFLLSFFFMILSFKSLRFIEYWMPFSILFFAIWCNSILGPGISKAIKDVKDFKNHHPALVDKKITHFHQRSYRILRTALFKFEKRFIKYLTLTALLFLVIYFSFYKIIVFSMLTPEEDHLYLESIREGAFWLEENTPLDSVVLNFKWHSFTFLFFYNHHNYYCNGMDPTFMYVKNPKAYWKWNNLLTEGIVCEQEKCDEDNQEINNEKEAGIRNFLKEELKGDHLFLLDSPKEEFIEFLDSSPNFEKVFKRGKIEIYEIN